MSDNKSLDNVFKLVHSLKRNLHDQIEELELEIVPMHVRVLKIITFTPNCTAVNIATYLDRDKAQVTRLLSSLVEQELIIKKPNPEDKRSQCLGLTESGEKIITKIRTIDNKIFKKMTAGISEEELEEFSRVTGLIVGNLNA